MYFVIGMSLALSYPDCEGSEFFNVMLAQKLKTIIRMPTADNSFNALAKESETLLMSACEVQFGYKGIPVIGIDSLVIRPGERVALVGRSGCGKTTVLATIAGMIELISGELQFQGAPRDALWRARNTARTVQSFPLFHWLTVRQNLLLACRIRGVKPHHIDKILEQFAASKLANRFPKGLSGGERCRASLAQAVVADPNLLLLDEPFTGLDTIVKEDVAASLFEFARRTQIGVLLVTHDLNDAIEFSDRVLVLGGSPVTRVLAEVPTNHPSALTTVRSLLREGGNV
jgi:ABC-type nitrate/sulfonate/bicarbonate transport system ATPase subunit